MHHLAALCISVALLACATSKSFRRPFPEVPPPVAALPYEEWPRTFKTPKTLEQARKRRQALEQLPPDRRFLLAFGDIATLMGKEPGAVAEARFAAGRWVIVYRNQVVAEVASFADYGELTAALVRWAEDVAGESKSSEPASSIDVILLDDAVASESAAVNAAWEKGERSPAIIGRAAHLLTSVAFEVNDTLEVADSLFGRAWALAALAQVKGVRTQSDEVLLASALGYKAAARTAALKAEDDAVRAFAESDWNRLDALVQQRPSSADVRYLRLRALVAGRRREQIMQLLSARDMKMQLSTLTALARADAFELKAEYPLRSAVTELALLQNRVASGGGASVAADKSEAPHPLADMETALIALPSRTGVPFDTEIERAALRARFFSNVELALKFHLESRGIVSESEEFLKILGPATGIAGEFQDWLSIRVQQVKGMNAGLLESAISCHWGHLGASAVARIILSEHFSASRGSGEAVDAAGYFLRRADSRPRQRDAQLAVSKALLVDPGLTNRATARWAAVSGDVWSLSALRVMEGDWAGLDQIAADPSIDIEQRYAATSKLFDEKQLTVDEATRRLGALAHAPGGDVVRGDYEAFLVTYDRAAEQIALVEPWIRSHADDDSLAAAHMRVNLARAYRMTGRTNEAWQTIEPAMETGAQSPLFQGSLALLALGRTEEAIEWGQRIRKRYAGPSGTLDLAGILWRAGKPQEAARVLKGSLSQSDWNEMAPNYFRNAFEHASAKDVEAAFDALVAVETTPNLIWFAYGLAGDDRFDYATTLALKLRDQSPDTTLDIYRWLRPLKGNEEAEKWFWGRCTPQQFMPLAYEALTKGTDSLLFSMPSTPALSPADMELVWTLRAMSLARKRLKQGPEFELVRKHYASEVAVALDNELEVLLSKFLMGLEKQESILARATTPNRAMRVGLYLALAAERDGRIEDAAEYYLDVMDLHQGNDEWTWARKRLIAWRNSDKSLKRLGDEGP